MNSNEMKHKMMRKKWMTNDSGMRDDLSKRGQIVNQMIGIYSSENDVSMEEAAIKLDEIRVSSNKTAIQHWKNWRQSKNG